MYRVNTSLSNSYEGTRLKEIESYHYAAAGLILIRFNKSKIQVEGLVGLENRQRNGIGLGIIGGKREGTFGAWIENDPIVTALREFQEETKNALSDGECKEIYHAYNEGKCRIFWERIGKFVGIVFLIPSTWDWAKQATIPWIPTPTMMGFQWLVLPGVRTQMEIGTNLHPLLEQIIKSLEIFIDCLLFAWQERS